MNVPLSTSDQEYWEKIKREEPLSAITKCEEAAKQLITLTSLLSTIYIGIVSFSEILKQPLLLRSCLLFLLLPLPFWFASLFLATRVVVPRIYTVSVDEIQDDYMKISRVKYSFLQWSYVLLMFSVLTLIAVIALYILYVPPPPA